MRYIRVFFSLTILLAMANILLSCKVDTSLDQFYARVKLEYTLEDSTLTIKNVDIQELLFSDRIISIAGNFTPKMDKEGYMRVTKSNYDIRVKAKIEYIDKEGKESNQIYFQDCRDISIAKDGIIKIVFKIQV